MFGFNIAYGLAAGTELTLSGSPFVGDGTIVSREADYNSTGMRAIYVLGPVVTVPYEDTTFDHQVTYTILEDMTEQFFDIVDTTGTTEAPDLNALNAALKTQITQDAEAANSTYVSTIAKPFVYARKAWEILEWSQLSEDDKAALSTSDKQVSFPFLYYDAAAFGDTMNDAYDRFYTGYLTSTVSLAQIEAGIQKAYFDMTKQVSEEARIDTVQNAVSSVTIEQQGRLTDENGDYLTDEDGIYFTI